MGGWMDGWMGGWINGWMNGWVDEWISGWMDSFIFKRTLKDIYDTKVFAGELSSEERNLQQSLISAIQVRLISYNEES